MSVERRIAGTWNPEEGGFSRYSVDAHWLVPHFEKMLYDNAQLTSLYLDAYLISGRSRYACSLLSPLAGRAKWVFLHGSQRSIAGLFSGVPPELHQQSNAWWSEKDSHPRVAGVGTDSKA